MSAPVIKNGHQIVCARCCGNGLVWSWSFGVKEADECADCGGTGRNWQYHGGAIAKYYSGPLIGRTIPEPQP